MDLKKLLLNEANTDLSYVVNSEKVSFENADNKVLPELTIYKGATFKPDGKGNLVSKTKFNFLSTASGEVVMNYNDYAPLETIADIKYYTYSDNVIYNCKTNKFSVPNKSPEKYFAEDSPAPELVKKLNNLCFKSKNQKDFYGAESVGGGKSYTQKNNYPLTLKDSSKKIIIPAGTGYSYREGKNGASFRLPNKSYGWFGCNSKQFQIGGKIYKDTNGGLVNILVKNLCGSVGNTQTTPEPPQYIGGGGAQTTQSQTPTLIKQIQKTIGVAETGKLTDTEIQTIYDKLNPSAPVDVKPEKLPYLPAGQVKSDTAPTQLAGVPLREEVNRIKEMMGIVLNEQSTPTEPQPEKTPTEKLQELLNTKFSVGLDVDGKMGPKTAQAIINALGKTTTTSSQATPTPSPTNQTSTDTKPTDNTSPEPKLGDNKETIPTI
jgi:hypothetical protein